MRLIAILRRLLFLSFSFTLLSFIACSGGDKRDAKSEISNYNWMEGRWNSSNDPRIWEIWSADSVGLHGFSYRISSKDSVLLEKMHIVPRDTAIYFIADLPENSENVEFLLIRNEVNRLRFVNAAHEFPKEISYQKMGHNTIRAEVKGNNEVLKFLFVKR